MDARKSSFHTSGVACISAVAAAALLNIQDDLSRPEAMAHDVIVQNGKAWYSDDPLTESSSQALEQHDVVGDRRPRDREALTVLAEYEVAPRSSADLYLVAMRQHRVAVAGSEGVSENALMVSRAGTPR